MDGIKILLVEDDSNFSYVISDFLKMEGFDVTKTYDGKEALQTFNKKSFDICVIDIMLPKMDGFKLAEKIKKEDEFMPIIFMTAKSMSDDKIRGLKIGADDYITKPFEPEELSLRIKTVMKRYLLFEKPDFDELKEIEEIGNYKFNTKTFELKIGESSQKLTPKEGKLLALLLLHKDDMLNRNEALRNIWHKVDAPASRSMDVYILKLRNYLDKDSRVNISNYHGKGFKLDVAKN
jgi:DNA-binding response OmpR family regulator